MNPSRITTTRRLLVVPRAHLRSVLRKMPPHNLRHEKRCAPRRCLQTTPSTHVTTDIALIGQDSAYLGFFTPYGERCCGHASRALSVAVQVLSLTSCALALRAGTTRSCSVPLPST